MRLLPESYQNFIIKRSFELLGISILLLSCFIFLSLLSFSPSDPSVSNLNNYEVSNLGGKIGANVSDLLIQLFGHSSFILIVVLLSWSYKLIFHKNLPLIALHTFLLPFFLTSISVFINLLDLSSINGFISDEIRNSLLSHGLLSTNVNYILLLISVFSFSIILLFFSMGLSKKDWILIMKVIYQILFKLVNLLILFIKIILRKFSKSDSTSMSQKQELIEPKIDFENIKNEPVSNFGQTNINETLMPVQKEIDLNDDEYKSPSIDFLSQPDKNIAPQMNEGELHANSEMLKKVLADFKIEGEIINISPGPIVTMYELQPAPGVKASKIISLSDDIARNMSAMSARVAIIPGRNVVGIEIPNDKKQPVYLSELFLHEKFIQNGKSLILALGKDINGKAIFANLEDMPHLLIAGTTGSGKSVGINVMITSILFKHSPDDCKFILIDPKMLELSVYEGVPHLITPVVTDPKKAITALKWVVREMESRYQKMSLLGVRNIENYNSRIADAGSRSETIKRFIPAGINPETGQPITKEVEIETKKMPFIVVVVDEMADLMMVAGKEIEHAIQRLSQMARAAGIHLIMATQRPSVDVITGTIKANFPSRISFQVSSKFDSRTILGEEGAERLLGKGDMLMMTAGGRTTRIHGPFISDNEIEKIVKSLQKQGLPEFDEEITKDDTENELDNNIINDDDKDTLFKQSLEIIKKEGKASTSLLQRKLQIGYNRAARIMDQLEEDGYISPANHVGKREINFDKFN